MYLVTRNESDTQVSIGKDARKEALKIMKKRAAQYVGDIYGTQDPASALKAGCELFAEASDWLTKYPVDMVAQAFIPAFKAAADMMASVEAHLKVTTDPLENERHTHAILKEAMQLAANGGLVH